MIIIAMFLLFSLMTYITFNPPHHRFTKRKLFSFSAILLSFVILSGCADNSIALDLENEIERNEQLTEESEELEENYEKLQEKYDELSTSITALEDENKKLLDKNELLSTEYEKSSEDIAALENENKQLQKKLDKEKKANASSKSAAKTTATETNTSTSTTTSSQASSSSTSDSSTASEDCDIKGSVNGIYHVPGSTYYSRTKNVVQWFCSTKEAENAGYRAPEK